MIGLNQDKLSASILITTMIDDNDDNIIRRAITKKLSQQCSRTTKQY